MSAVAYGLSTSWPAWCAKLWQWLDNCFKSRLVEKWDGHARCCGVSIDDPVCCWLVYAIGPDPQHVANVADKCAWYWVCRNPLASSILNLQTTGCNVVVNMTTERCPPQHAMIHGQGNNSIRTSQARCPCFLQMGNAFESMDLSLSAMHALHNMPDKWLGCLEIYFQSLPGSSRSLTIPQAA